MDDEPAMLGDFRKITVTPDIVESLEVGLVVLAILFIVPETNRHRRKRPGADQFTHLAFHRIAVVVENFDGHAQAETLQLACIDRLDRTAQ